MTYTKETLSLFFIIGILLMLGMLFVPFPAIVLEILFGIEFAVCIMLLVYSFTQHPKMMAKAVLHFTLYSLALNISFTRLSLSEIINDEQVSMASFISDFVIQRNYILGIFMILFLIVALLAVEYKGVIRISEISARFALDSMNQKIFDIDTRLAKNELSQDKAENLKMEVRNELNFYSSIDGVAKFAFGNAKATVFFTTINLLGAYLIERFILKKIYLEAIEAIVTYTIGNVIIFVIPQIIVAVAMEISLTAKSER